MSAAITLPAGLPSIARAKLPVTYEGAKVALSECSKVDECRDWADKAEALASYARQAGDDDLYEMAVKIKSRAIKRCGELLKQIAPADTSAGRPKLNGKVDLTISRTAAAREAGLSTHQKRDALRLANIPDAEFDALVERDGRKPTIKELAAIGKKPARNLVDLKGRDPADFQLATQALGQINRLVEFASESDVHAIARGAFPRERKTMRRHVRMLVQWLRALDARLRKGGE